MTDRTDKEQRTIEVAEEYQHGLGKIIEKGIDNPNSGFKERIADTPIEEIKVQRKEEK
ncbi:MAG: hypothetical protein AAF316_00585 [Cyanobacteria bacterium P01_A01_bin.80]